MSATAMMTERPMHEANGEGAGAAQPERFVLSAAQVEHFHREGYLVVEGVVTGAALDELRAVTDEFFDRARELDASEGPIDLSPDHTRERPQVRRIIDPDRHHPVYEAATRIPEVLDVVCDLLGPDIRFDHSKLNCKPPAGGVPIEWHQTGPSIPRPTTACSALSLMLDDCDLENGPLLVIPGSHQGPTWDHHYQGRFIGAIDPATADFDESSALALVGPAGSVAIHHVRTVHGSADSISGRQRRLLNMNYATTATWPLLGWTRSSRCTSPASRAFTPPRCGESDLRAAHGKAAGTHSVALRRCRGTHHL